MLRGTEINASFYRPLRPALYEKWAAAVAFLDEVAVLMELLERLE